MTDNELPDDVSPAWGAILAALGRLPQGALSRGAGWVADTPLPPAWRRAVLGAFARTVGIDVTEAELPLEEYVSIGDFFVRRLRPGARAWPDDSAVLASPVDGVVGRFGAIARGRALQAKGRDYSVGDLLAEPDAGWRYEGGVYLTIYLSPRHYHRIHSPCGGVITRATHVPGALLPVNAAAVAKVPDLFARNERLICTIDGPPGRVPVVAVGAYNVGRITASFERLRHERHPHDTMWRTNVRGAVGESRNYDPPVPVRQGDEIMAFQLGSTVVMLFERGRVVLDPELRAGDEVRAGTVLGRIENNPEPR